MINTLRLLDGGPFLAIDSNLFALDPLAGYAATVPAEALRAESLAEAVAKARPSIRQDVDGVAVIDIRGPLRANPGFMRTIEVYFGLPISATYGEIQREIRAAGKDPAVLSTLLRVSSPGGSVFGVSELADEVAAQRSSGGRIKAYAQDLAASAAYWIAAQASEVIANEIAHVGSIGVFAVVVDSSKAFEEWGYRVIPVRSTAGKATIIDGAPVSDEAIADLESLIRDVAGVFVGAVARGRKMTVAAAEELHTGKVYVGKKALDAGLVDRIASFDDVLLAEVRAARQLRANTARARSRMAR